MFGSEDGNESMWNSNNLKGAERGRRKPDILKRNFVINAYSVVVGANGKYTGKCRGFAPAKVHRMLLGR